LGGGVYEGVGQGARGENAENAFTKKPALSEDEGSTNRQWTCALYIQQKERKSIQAQTVRGGAGKKKVVTVSMQRLRETGGKKRAGIRGK